MQWIYYWLANGSQNIEVLFFFCEQKHNVWSIETNEIKYLRVNCASSVRFMNNFGSRDTRQPEGLCVLGALGSNYGNCRTHLSLQHILRALPSSFAPLILLFSLSLYTYIHHSGSPLSILPLNFSFGQCFL